MGPYIFGDGDISDGTLPVFLDGEALETLMFFGFGDGDKLASELSILMDTLWYYLRSAGLLISKSELIFSLELDMLIMS